MPTADASVAATRAARSSRSGFQVQDSASGMGNTVRKP